MRQPSLTIIALALVLNGFGTCSPSVHEICNSRLPDFRYRLARARIALVAKAGLEMGKANRGLASTGEFDEWTQEKWQKWAEGILTEAQSYLDVSDSGERYFEARKELSRAADSIVLFHGYSQKNDWARMTMAIARITDHAERARELACRVE